MKLQKVKCYENYPLSTVFVSNLLNILIYAIGFYIIYQLGWIWSLVFLVYIFFLEFRVLSKSCVNCYYYGRYCAFGKGKLCSLFFSKETKKFNQRRITWIHVLPDFLISLIPIIVGIIVLIINFSWLILVLIILLFILMTIGNSFVRGQLACKFCKQKELGCPAEKLFNKKKK
jgi:hypothetical protein